VHGIFFANMRRALQAQTHRFMSALAGALNVGAASSVSRTAGAAPPPKKSRRRK
jgi:hypothetical protein